MMRLNLGLQWYLFLVAAVACAGCGSTPRATAPAPASNSGPPAATDACADRLHEICGSLLLYYATHHRLPENLAALRTMGQASLALECPISGKPYTYYPDGIVVPGVRGHVVIFDPEPTHSGHHWAISVEDYVAGPLITRVVAVPGAQFVIPSNAPTVGREPADAQPPQ